MNTEDYIKVLQSRYDRCSTIKMPYTPYPESMCKLNADLKKKLNDLNKESQMCDLSNIPENAYCLVRNEQDKENDEISTNVSPLIAGSLFNQKYVFDYREAVELCRGLEDKKYFLVQLKGIMSNKVENSFDKTNN